jgi:hypothetical protein
MSERKDEKWLDEELRRAVDGAAPEFDAEAWKQKYPDEFQAVVSRGRQSVQDQRRNRVVRLRFGRPLFGLATAAAIVVVAAVLFVGPGRQEPPDRGSGPQPVAPSPAKIVTMMSLSMAFRRGGTEALNRQFDQALRKLGPRPNGVSVANLLGDLES